MCVLTAFCAFRYILFIRLRVNWRGVNPAYTQSFSFTGTFWVRHLGLPLTVAILILFALEHSGIDLWLADAWYQLEGGRWAWRNHWLTYDLIHHYGKVSLLVFGAVLIGFLAVSPWLDRYGHLRWPVGYALTSMIVLPTLIAYSKHFSPVPCPWDLSRYGGNAPYLHTFDYSFASGAAGHCFPAGNAAGGFALVALYFAMLPYVRRPSMMLIPGLGVGTVFALGQQARGAHFVSHDLWTLSLCWFGALALFLMFRPQRWVSKPHPARKPD